MAEDRRDLEREIRKLKEEKASIEEGLVRMEANQHRVEEMAARRAKEREEKGSPSPKRKGEKGSPSPKRARSEGSDGKGKDEKKDEKDEKEEKGDKEKEGEKGEGKDGEKDKDKDEKDDKDKKPARESKTKAADNPRGRAMFGKLLGHLQMAKTRLETEKGWKSAALNRKAQERLEHKISLQKMGIQELKRSQYEENVADEKEKLIQLAKDIEEKEVRLLEKTLESHYTHMMNFIRTKTEPSLFYLPAKQTKETDSMLDDTRSAIKNKISSLKVELSQPPQEADERASAAAAVNAAVEGKFAARDEDDEEPSIPRDAPQNAKEAAGSKDKDDSDDEKSDKKSDDKDDKSDKEESKSDKDGPAAKRRRKDDEKDEASEDKASGKGGNKAKKEEDEDDDKKKVEGAKADTNED